MAYLLLFAATAFAACPNGLTEVNCFVNPCQVTKCASYPDATCRSNYCGGCNAEFFDAAGNQITDCTGSGSGSGSATTGRPILSGATLRPATDRPILPGATLRPGTDRPILPGATLKPATSRPILPGATLKPATDRPILSGATLKPATDRPILSGATLKPATDRPILSGATLKPATDRPILSGATLKPATIKPILSGATLKPGTTHKPVGTIKPVLTAATAAPGCPSRKTCVACTQASCQWINGACMKSCGPIASMCYTKASQCPGVGTTAKPAGTNLPGGPSDKLASPTSCPDGSKPVQCLIDPCATANGCPDYPNAVCKSNYCGGCNYNYYQPGVNVPVNCNAGSLSAGSSGTNTCPNGAKPVQCLIDPCATAKGCPAYPRATCKANYCGGCNYNFYLPGVAVPVNCDAGSISAGGNAGSMVTGTPRAGTCPDGSNPVQCLVDPCMTATCPRNPNAVCRANYCGGCNALWYNADGNQVACKECPLRKCTACASEKYGRDADGCPNCNCLPQKTCPQVKCMACDGVLIKDINGCQTCQCIPRGTGKPTGTTARPGTGTPKPTQKPGTCPDGSNPVQCFVDPCRTATCPAAPNAVCRANYCGGCNAVFYNAQNVRVTCGAMTTRAPQPTSSSGSSCPNGQPPVQCLVNPCSTAKCEGVLGAICKPNYCGGCAADFFNAAGEKLDCVRNMPSSCPVLRCMGCPVGQSFIKDARGCDTCTCADDSASPRAATTAAPEEPKCGPVCMIYCENGNVMDANGCPTCKCNPSPTRPMGTGMMTQPTRPMGTGMMNQPTRPMPPMGTRPMVMPTQPSDTTPNDCGPVCMIFCENGNVLDERGCPTCKCK